ncbi:MAG: BrnT family toxin [Caulobacterales bacterium]|nr:BrnT family toxin [Caulobacterales bacterium]MCA0371258.1 BrnT family toxin [Pseudomonadota bacterium]
MINFTWDNKKAKSNIEKHGVSFEEAKTVFYDEMALQYFDNINSDTEDRFIMLGLSAKLRLLVVVYCERGEGDIIRIISARKATKNEGKNYGE